MTDKSKENIRWLKHIISKKLNQCWDRISQTKWNKKERFKIPIKIIYKK